MLLSMPKDRGSEGHSFGLQKIDITKVLKGGPMIVLFSVVVCRYRRARDKTNNTVHLFQRTSAQGKWATTVVGMGTWNEWL
jgi:hypothetical protein